jgi:hypothetical protein
VSVERLQELRGSHRRLMDVLFFVSLKHGYLYAQAPKVASSTLNRRLVALELQGTGIAYDEEALHLAPWRAVHVRPFQMPKPLLVKTFFGPGSFRFCFVRNPYARLLSAWLDKIRPGQGMAGPVFAHFGRDASDPQSTVGFAEFVAWLEAQRDRIGQWNMHWRPMARLLRPDLIPYDLIGRLERFEEDFATLSARIGTSPAREAVAVPHLTRAADRLAEFYTQDLRDRVAALYAEDFAAFGYPA